MLKLCITRFKLLRVTVFKLQCYIIKDANSARMKELNAEELCGRMELLEANRASLGRRNMSKHRH